MTPRPFSCPAFLRMLFAALLLAAPLIASENEGSVAESAAAPSLLDLEARRLGGERGGQ